MFKFLDTHTYNMPCHFGGTEGSGISVYYNDNTILMSLMKLKWTHWRSLSMKILRLFLR